MNLHLLWRWAFLAFFFCSAAAQAQQVRLAASEPEGPQASASAETQVSVLRLMKFSGVLGDRLGHPRTGVVGLTFTLYKDQQGGSPLWLEVHNAQLDEQGRYTALLGSTKSEGLPLELFSSGEARWLGVQLNLPGEEEQPRVLLVSVPYALKAADAETLGGKPPSAFLLAEKAEGREAAAGKPEAEAGKEAVKEGPPREGVVGPINGEGTVDSLAKFTGANSIGNAGIVDVAGKVGIGTAAPNVKLSLGTDITAQKLALYDGVANFYGLGVQGGRIVVHTANSEKMTITEGGNVGIGTTAPAAKLAVTGSGTGDVRFGDPGCGGNYTGIWLNQLTANCSNYNLTSSPSDQTLYVNRPAGAGIEFREGNAAQMVVKASGNVGIGTTVPAQKLEVVGNIKVTGTGNGVIFPDGSLQTTACGPTVASPPGAIQAASGCSGTEAISRLIATVKEQQAHLKELESQVQALKARVVEAEAERRK